MPYTSALKLEAELQQQKALEALGRDLLQNATHPQQLLRGQESYSNLMRAPGRFVSRATEDNLKQKMKLIQRQLTSMRQKYTQSHTFLEKESCDSS